MFQRITIWAAKKLFAEGKPIILCACKMRPGEPWYPQVEVSNKSGRTFDQVKNEFVYYNCSTETGKYPHYYIEGPA